MFRLFAVVAGILLLAMMLHVTADVLSKYLLNNPLPGTLEIVSAHYMVFSVFLPLGLVEWTRKSVAVDLFYNFFPRPAKLVIITFVLALMTLVYAALAWQTWEDAVAAYNRSDFLMGGSVRIVIWQSRFALPLGFGAAALVSAWHLLGVLVGFDRDYWLTSHSIEDAGLE